MHFMPPDEEGAIKMEDVLDDGSMENSIKRSRQLQIQKAQNEPAFKQRMIAAAKELMEIEFWCILNIKLIYFCLKITKNW